MALTKLTSLAVIWAALSAPSEIKPPIPDAVVPMDCLVTVASAVKIGTDLYITAAHVVAGHSCTIYGNAITDIKTAPDQDFATFRGPSSPVTAKYTCKGYKGGEEYLAIGYADGLPFLSYMPWIASHFHFDDQQAFTGEAIPGMSGGAVIDQSKRVVGIVNRRWPARSIPLKDTSICK